MARVLRGLAALLGLLLLVVGIPVGLYIAGGSPIPAGVDLGAVKDSLTRPDDGTMFLQILKYVGWLAWLSFTAMVVLEVFAQLTRRKPDARGVRAPRIPAFGIQQRAAAGLVGAIAVMFTAASPLLTAGAAHAEAPMPHAHVATHQGQHKAAPQQVTPQAQAPTHHQVETKTYVVQPGDSLYSIAEHLLGDGAKFKEIANLNYGVQQADGGALTESHWIQPGWKLQVPAHGLTGTPDHVVVQPGDTLSEIAQETLGDANAYPELFDATQNVTQPGGAHLTDPDLILPGWTISIPTQNVGGHTSTEQQPAGGNNQQDPAQVPGDHNAQPDTGSDGDDQDEQQDQQQPAPESAVPSAAPETTAPSSGSSSEAAPDSGAAAAAINSDQAGDSADEVFSVRTVGGVGALLAAGLLGLIAVRRARQQRRRKPGQPMPMPAGETLEVEQELRAVADPVSVELVDLALRRLAAACAGNEQPLPKVRAARLTADQFDLYLAEPAALPTPWQGDPDQVVWSLTNEAEGELSTEELAGVASPYPALVTLGHDEEDGHVLVDLEYLGALGINGDEDTTRQVMAALAVELATSRWADDLQVTIVGAYSELEDSLETGRVRYMPAVGRLLDELQHRATQDREALVTSGAGDLSHARVTGAVPGTWTPEILLLTGDISNAQRAKLETLVAELPRVALAAVTTGESVGEWNVRITGPQTAVLEPYGLGLQPQLLDDATYAQVLQVLAVTDAEEEPAAEEWSTHPEPTLADVDAVIATHPAEVDEDQDVEHGDEPAAPLVEAEPFAALLEDDQNEAAESAESAEDAAQEQLVPAAEEEVPEADELATAEAAAGDSETGDVPGVPPAPTTTPVSVSLEEDLVDESTYVDLPPGEPVTEETPAADAAAEVVIPEPAKEPEVAAVALMPKRGPRILVLGPVEIEGAMDALVEPTRRNRLTELAVILANYPGCDYTTIDECYYPGKRNEDNNNSRNTAMSKLRRWLGKSAEGDDYLPRYATGDRYRFHPDVTYDWDDWNQLLPDGPAAAPSANIEAALRLVRGQPFKGIKARHYTWSESLKQEAIAAILDASYELARRRLMDGRWRDAEEATLVGIGVEPGVERLWRARILATHARGNIDAVQEVVDRFLALAEHWGGDLEPETEELLEQLRTDTVPTRSGLTAGAR